MNKRIRELAEQASKWVCENDPRSLDDDELFRELSMEKFAELIARECANIANEQFSVASGLDDRDCWTAAEIKKRFGVE